MASQDAASLCDILVMNRTSSDRAPFGTNEIVWCWSLSYQLLDGLGCNEEIKHQGTWPPAVSATSTTPWASRHPANFQWQLPWTVNLVIGELRWLQMQHIHPCPHYSRGSLDEPAHANRCPAQEAGSFCIAARL